MHRPGCIRTLHICVLIRWGVLACMCSEPRAHLGCAQGDPSRSRQMNLWLCLRRGHFHGRKCLNDGKSCGHVQVDVRLLLKGGGIHPQDWLVVPSQDLEGSENKENNIKLQEAAERGDVDAIDHLIKAGAEVNARGPGLWSALHVAARYGHAEVVQRLVQHGANMEQRSGSHFTALHHAAMRGHADVIAVLASEKADLLATTLEGHTAMDWAERNGHLKAMLTIDAFLKAQDGSEHQGVSRYKQPDELLCAERRGMAASEDSGGAVRTSGGDSCSQDRRSGVFLQRANASSSSTSGR